MIKNAIINNDNERYIKLLVSQYCELTEFMKNLDISDDDTFIALCVLADTLKNHFFIEKVDNILEIIDMDIA